MTTTTRGRGDYITPSPAQAREKGENIMLSPIKKAVKDKAELSAAYGVPESSIVWIGNNHYIVVKDGKEIRI